MIVKLLLEALGLLQAFEESADVALLYFCDYSNLHISDSSIYCSLDKRDGFESISNFLKISNRFSATLRVYLNKILGLRTRGAA